MNKSFSDHSELEMELEKAMGLSDATPEFVQSLRRKMLILPKPNHRQHSFVWRFAAIMVLALTILFFFAGPQNVLAAVREWVGQYLPGIGFVEDSSNLRILAEPANIQMEGVDLTIRWAYTTNDETIIAFPEGKDTRLCRNWLVYSPETHQKIQDLSLGILRLPDGRELEWNFNGGYMPIPANINDVSLIIYSSKEVPGCPEDASCRCMDEDQRFEIPLKFIPPPPGSELEIYDMQFTPVVPTVQTDSETPNN